MILFPKPVLLLFLVPPAALAQQPQGAADASARQIDALVAAAKRTGGLLERQTPGGGAPELQPGDPDRLRSAVRSYQPRLDTDARVALIARCYATLRSPEPIARSQVPGLVALLKVVAEDANDKCHLGHALFVEGELFQSRNDSPRALGRFEQAARLFQSAGKPIDEGNCYSAMSTIHAAKAEIPAALELERKALDGHRKGAGERSMYAASRLEAIGLLESGLGHHSEARQTLERALEIWKQIEGERSAPYAGCLEKTAIVHYRRLDYRRAAEAQEQAIEILGQKGKDSLEYAASLEALASYRSAMEDDRRARALLQDAIAIRKARAGPRSPRVAADLIQLAKLLARAGQVRQAIGANQEALGMLAASRSTQFSEWVSAKNGLASLRTGTGDLTGAIEDLNQADTFIRAEAGDVNLERILIKNHLAIVYSQLGDPLRSLREAQDAVRIGESLPMARTILHNLYDQAATAYIDLGDKEKAIAMGEKAVSSARSAVGDDHTETSRMLSQSGQRLYELREYPRARKRLEEALALQKRQVDRQPSAHIRTLVFLGRVEQLQQHWNAAASCYRQAIDQVTSRFGPRHSYALLARSALARTNFDRGDYKAAAELLEGLQQDLRAFEQAAGPNFAGNEVLLGVAWSKLGDDRRAGEAFDAALRTLAVVPPTWPAGGLPSSASQLRTLSSTVDALFQYGTWLESRDKELQRDAAELPPSLQAHRLATEVLDNLRSRVLSTEEGKILAGERASELSTSLLGLEARSARGGSSRAKAERLLQDAEGGLARVFLEELARARAFMLGGVSSDVLVREKAIQSDLDRLEQQLAAQQALPVAKRRPERSRALLEARDMKQAELVTFHRTLEQTYPIYASLRFPTPCTLEQARACLDDDEVGLVYLTGASRSYLVVLTKMPTDRPAIHELPAVAVISELINALTDETNLGRETKTRRLGAEAYQMLLALAAPAIAGKHLVIVAGGALGLLPFELLVEPGADGRGHFLVEGRRIRYAPSFTTLHVNALWDAKRRRPDRPLFALGNPVYRPADFAAATGDPADVFAPLPASALEVERIRNLMAAKPDDVLVGASASEHRLKALSCAAMLARYRYLHFASHGLLGLSEGRQPSLVLTQAGDLEGEDGFLRLDEVTGLHLNADLVVLSACRTGQGRSYNAEGVSGLARGFLFAGSRGVVCSLWRVSDQPTSEWMSELYQSLKSGQAAPEAVRTARLRRLAAGEPPLHWAPFVLIGR